MRNLLRNKKGKRKTAVAIYQVLLSDGIGLIMYAAYLLHFLCFETRSDSKRVTVRK